MTNSPEAPDQAIVKTTDLPLLMRLVNSAVDRHRRRYKTTPDESADLRQDGIIAALAASSSFEPSMPASYPTWITRRVQGQLIDSTRKLRSHGITHIPPKVTPVIVSQSPSGHNDEDEELDSLECESCLISPDAQADIEQSMLLLELGLSPADRELLSLSFGFHGAPLTERELAVRFDCSQQAINQRLSRVLRRARVLLTTQSVLSN